MDLTGPVGVIGAGVIGRSWALVFARAGFETRIYDSGPARAAAAAEWLESEVGLGHGEGNGHKAAQPGYGRIKVCSTLEEALDAAIYVQENGPEKIEEKQAIYRALDAAASPHAILASSTSTHDMSIIAHGLAGAGRCIVAHPVNPPHVIPVVEILPGQETLPEVVSETVRLMNLVGQKPVVLKRYAQGFLLNRMQAALIREAVNLVEQGVADVEAVDTVIRDGLGLRWTLMGPFAVANTNADGGVREYLGRYSSTLRSLMDDLGPTPALDSESIERIARATDKMEHHATVPELLRWRDRQILRIRELKQADPHPSRE